MPLILQFRHSSAVALENLLKPELKNQRLEQNLKELYFQLIITVNTRTF